MLFLGGIFLVLQSKKLSFLFLHVLYLRVLLCNFSNFIYGTNMLIPGLQNMYFKEKMRFIIALSLLLSVSVCYKDRPTVWHEELKPAFRQWIQRYCPVKQGQLLHFYGLCSLTDVISIIRYWVESSSGTAKIAKTLNYCFMFRLLTEFIIVNSVLSDYILCMMSSDLKQNGDLFSRCCFTVLKYRNSALEEAFSPDLLFCQVNSLPLQFPVAVHYTWANYAWTTERLIASPVQASCLGPSWF